MNGWYWANEDSGIMGPLPTRREVVAHLTGAPVIERHDFGPGAFEYVFGFPGEDTCSQWYVFRADSSFGYMLDARPGRQPAHINKTMWLAVVKGQSRYLPRCSCRWGFGDDLQPSTTKAGAQRRYLEHLGEVS